MQDTAAGPSTTTMPLTAPSLAGTGHFRPETFRLPRPGERDPFWGLGRSFYYAAEKAGDIKLIRLRKRGNIRGVTLVPYDAVAKLVHEAAGGRE